MSIGQVSSPRPGRDGNNGENSGVDLQRLAKAGSDFTLVAYVGDRKCEIKPFPVREGVSTAMMLMFFTPVFPLASGIGRWSVSRVIENKSCGVETNEGENG